MSFERCHLLPVAATCCNSRSGSSSCCSLPLLVATLMALTLIFCALNLHLQPVLVQLLLLSNVAYAQHRQMHHKCYAKSPYIVHYLQLISRKKNVIKTFKIALQVFSKNSFSLMKIVKRKLRRVQKKTGKKRKRASSIMSAKIVSVW